MIKGGNNGGVSCSAFCAKPQFYGDRAFSKCLGAKNSLGAALACDAVQGLARTKCVCKSGPAAGGEQPGRAPAACRTAAYVRAAASLTVAQVVRCSL